MSAISARLVKLLEVVSGGPDNVCHDGHFDIQYFNKDGDLMASRTVYKNDPEWERLRRSKP